MGWLKLIWTQQTVPDKIILTYSPKRSGDLAGF